MSDFPKFHIIPRLQRVAYRTEYHSVIQLKDLIVHIYSEFYSLEKRYHNTIKIVTPDEQGEFVFYVRPTRYPARELHVLNKILTKVTCFYSYLKRTLENSIKETNDPNNYAV